MQTHSVPGLRQQKKIATRRAIEVAAVDIAAEHGYRGATAELIAERAGVSLRTFFNYFPHRDDAIAGTAVALRDISAARATLACCEPHLLQGVVAVAEQCAPLADQPAAMLGRRRMLIDANPELLHRHLRAITDFEGELTTVVAQHLREEPGRRRLSTVSVEEEARIVVTIVGSAVRYGVEAWLADERQGAALHPNALIRTLDMMAAVHAGDS